MPPLPYSFSPRAEEQFANILYNIAEHSGWERSMRVEEKLYTAFRGLAANPGLGHLRTDLVPRRIYFYYVEPYHVLYLRDTLPLYIVAIYHGARDIATLMSDDPEQS